MLKSFHFNVSKSIQQGKIYICKISPGQLFSNVSASQPQNNSWRWFWSGACSTNMSSKSFIYFTWSFRTPCKCDTSHFDISNYFSTLLDKWRIYCNIFYESVTTVQMNVTVKWFCFFLIVLDNLQTCSFCSVRTKLKNIRSRKSKYNQSENIFLQLYLPNLNWTIRQYEEVSFMRKF